MKTLENKKVYVGKHSKEIQEKAFKLGFDWLSFDTKAVKYLDKPFLHFNNRRISFSKDLNFFLKNKNDEITAEEILAMEVPKEEETFEPFQKVLVRDAECEVWEAGFFSHMLENKGVKYFYITSMPYNFCIDYETNKHLLGTTDNP